MTGWTVRLSLVAAMVWSVMLPLRAGVEPIRTANLGAPAQLAAEGPGETDLALPLGGEPWTLLVLGAGFIGIAALTSRRSDAND